MEEKGSDGAMLYINHIDFTRNSSDILVMYMDEFFTHLETKIA